MTTADSDGDGAGGTAPTLAEMMLRLADDPAVPPSRRRSVPALLSCAARIVGENPDRVRLDAALVGAPRRAAPARHRIGRAHLANVRSAVRLALRRAGVDAAPGREATPPRRPGGRCWTGSRTAGGGTS